MSFPRQNARTRRFTLGAPRTPTLNKTGDRLFFLRSETGIDPVHSLWLYHPVSGEETCLLDPKHLEVDENLPAAEQARRERARETGEGVVAYSISNQGDRAVAALGGRLFLVDVDHRSTHELPASPGAYDPQLNPTGTHVAYVVDGTLRKLDIEAAIASTSVTAVDPNSPPTTLTNNPAANTTTIPGETIVVSEPDISWGAADFIAAEELSRTRGFWWAPDGNALIAERVDETPVATWYIASPAEPEQPPRPIRYPAAGTNNAACSLAIFTNTNSRIDIAWDNESYPYLARVTWAKDHPPVLAVLNRAQTAMVFLAVDVETGETSELLRHENDYWVEVVPGSPQWHENQLVTVADEGNARRVMVDGQSLSTDDLQVRALIDTDDNGVLVTASADDPTMALLVEVAWDGTHTVLTPEPGVYSAIRSGETLALTAQNLATAGASLTVGPAAQVLATTNQPNNEIDRTQPATSHPGTQTGSPHRHTSGNETSLHTIASYAEVPQENLNIQLLELGERRLRAALLLPEERLGIKEKLPVLLDPYGGPHAQRVLQAQSAFWASQWLANQGFAVLVVDGRGTPARGPAWEREVHGDLAAPVLEDQIDGLVAAAQAQSRLDLTRVAIRGWSFGGYLAALAVLKRPDIFHAAVAGAPVTDWRLYDTAYTERYLGHPDEEPENYARTNLIPLAPQLERPLMLIHGLADDNVVMAHTLTLSRALLEAGRMHTVLPLSGVTHMTPQEEVAENLLLLQVEFLKNALAHP